MFIEGRENRFCKRTMCRRSGNSHVKYNLHKHFYGVKFSRFCSICEIILAVNGCNMDKRLESSWHLVYYQVSGEPEIAGCSHQPDINLGECGLAHKCDHHRHVILFFAC